MGYGDRVARTALTSRASAEALDAADPLAGFRDRFALGDGRRIYVDGNSLGPLAHDARDRLEARIDEWRDRLVTGWSEWVEAPAAVGERLAQAALGAAPGQTIVSDSTTVNLYKLCCAALDAYGHRVLVTDRDNFPTDRYVLEGLAAARGLQLELVDSPDDLRPEALVVLSHVAYRSGALADMATLTAAARAQGSRVVWDLSHSAGAVEIGLREAGVELAIGCTYKYLNGGPGAPAFLYVAAERQAELRSPIWGWFGQAEQFAMERPYSPVEGIGRFLAGTPPILDLAAVEAGVRLTAEAGVARLREKSVALTELIVALHDEWLAELGFSVGSPRAAAQRGSHVSLRHPEAWPICRALIERAAVVPDFRGPDSVRLGVAPLYTRFVDVWDALDRLRGLVARGDQRAVDATPARVT
jgi:kynureninase